MNKLHITAADIANGRIKNEERLAGHDGDVVIASDIGLVNITAAKISGSLIINRSVSLIVEEGLTVGGWLIIRGTLSVGGALVVGGSLSVGGSLFVSGALDVGGAWTLAGNSDFNPEREMMK
jgi:predicted acyltransferase (DUF342 family)